MCVLGHAFCPISQSSVFVSKRATKHLPHPLFRKCLLPTCVHPLFRKIRSLTKCLHPLFRDFLKSVCSMNTQHGWLSRSLSLPLSTPALQEELLSTRLHTLFRNSPHSTKCPHALFRHFLKSACSTNTYHGRHSSQTLITDVILLDRPTLPSLHAHTHSSEIV